MYISLTIQYVFPLLKSFLTHLSLKTVNGKLVPTLHECVAMCQPEDYDYSEDYDYYLEDPEDSEDFDYEDSMAYA
jgi:hypothetical protein